MSLADVPPAEAVAAATHAGVPILAATGVTVRYGSQAIIRDVSLAIAAGDRVALVGPNGAGKSTLLRVLTGMLTPSAGSVELCGSALGGLDRRTVARTVAVLALPPDRGTFLDLERFL